MVMSRSTEKKFEDCETVKKGIFDSLDGMAQEAEITLEQIYKFAKDNKELKFDDVRVWSFDDNEHQDYNCEMSFNGAVIRREPKFETVVKEVSVPIGRLARILGDVKTNIELENIVGYDFHIYDYGAEKRVEGLTLSEMAKDIKANKSISGAEEFAIVCKKIKELPTRITEYIIKTANEVNNSKLPVTAEGIDLRCGYCGAPNKSLKLFCDYCGQPAYNLTKK
jgi:hypothetical protein